MLIATTSQINRQTINREFVPPSPTREARARRIDNPPRPRFARRARRTQLPASALTAPQNRPEAYPTSAIVSFGLAVLGVLLAQPVAELAVVLRPLVPTF